MKPTHNKNWLCQIAAISVATCVAITAFGQSYPNSLWIGTDNECGNRKLMNVDRSGNVLREFTICDVTGIAIDPRAGTIYLGHSGQYGDPQVITADLATLAPIATNTPLIDPVYLQEDMAFDGTNLWRVGIVAGQLYQFSPADGHTISTNTVGFRALGVAWDGKTLWLSDNSSERVLTVAPDGTPTGQQFSVPFRVGGLAFDTTDNTLWVGANGGVYHYTTNGVQLGSFQVPFPGSYVDGLEFQPDVTGPRLSIDFYAGITIDGTVGTTNRIEYVTNLGDTNWITLTNLVLPQSPFLFFDVTSPRTQRRFYRAIQAP